MLNTREYTINNDGRLLRLPDQRSACGTATTLHFN
jgi:hypothetical protein